MSCGGKADRVLKESQCGLQAEGLLLQGLWIFSDVLGKSEAEAYKGKGRRRRRGKEQKRNANREKGRL